MEMLPGLASSRSIYIILPPTPCLVLTLLTPRLMPCLLLPSFLNLAVPQAKIPLFVIAVMPIIAVLCAVTAIMGITIYSPTGYASHKNREQKAPGNLAAKGMPAWLDRVQGAQHNTWEATMCLLCAVFVAMSSDFPKGFDKVGFLAKLTTFFLLCRVAYPVAYALDIDLLRTLLWFTGLYTTLMLSFGALLPDSILPMFG